MVYDVDVTELEKVCRVFVSDQTSCINTGNLGKPFNIGEAGAEVGLGGVTNGVVGRFGVVVSARDTRSSSNL
jgi:hypothetical protein